MPKLKFETVFPEYAHLRYWDYHKTPEYSMFLYLTEGNTIDHFARLRVLISANKETFYARDIFPNISSGGIINSLSYNCLIKETGNVQKYYIDDPYGKTAIIGYAKEWKLSMPRDSMILAYNRMRNAILEII